MFILTQTCTSSSIPALSAIIYGIYPKPWLLSPRPGKAARPSRPGMSIPGFWGGTKRGNITAVMSEHHSLSCSMFILVCASKHTSGKLGFTRTWGNTLKASSKNEQQNKKEKHPSSRGEFPDGDNPITEDGHRLPLGPCKTKVWVGEVKKIF